VARGTRNTLSLIGLGAAILAGLTGPPIAWVLAILPVYAAALWVVPRLRPMRPSAGIMRIATGLSVAALIVFLPSMLIEIECVTTPSEVWRFGRGAISHVTFATRTPHYPTAPDLRLQWSPCPCPVGGSYIALGRLQGGSSREQSRALWPLLACTVLPTLVLRQLRRERIAPGTCRFCGYDLTGNMSGRCPECGASVAGQVPG
jgi:hypothetical protein